MTSPGPGEVTGSGCAALRLSEARLEAPEVGALVRWVNLCGGGFAWGGQWASRRDAQLSRGLSCVGWGGVSGRRMRCEGRVFLSAG